MQRESRTGYLPVVFRDTMMARYVPFFTTLTLCLLLVGAAFGADPAEVLVREGVELRRAGRDADARQKFLQAYELSHTPRAAAQLGLCEMALDNFLEAEGYLTEALAAQSDPWIARNRAVIEESIAGARAHLGAVVVNGSPVGAFVTVNGKMVGRLPNPSKVYAVPGTVAVSASSAGFQNETKKLPLKAGEALQMSFDLKPTSASQHIPTAVSQAGPEAENSSFPARDDSATKVDLANTVAEPTTPRRWQKTAGWVSLGVGALSLGFGIKAHADRERDAKEFNRRNECGEADGKIYGGQGCDSLNDSVTSKTILAAIGYSSAAALTGLGLYWLITNKRDAGQADTTNVALRVTPTSILMSGSF